jgi:hypothetical protein
MATKDDKSDLGRNKCISITLRKNATLMERTMSRHLTPEEIALNQRELACRAEIELLEMQETSLEYEVEQDIDETRRMIVVQTLRVMCKALLTQHRELERIKDAQITSIQKKRSERWRQLKGSMLGSGQSL